LEAQLEDELLAIGVRPPQPGPQSISRYCTLSPFRTAARAMARLASAEEIGRA
jgi:hypothetical protein